ncbi:MAG TPA: protein kinase [Planctomycetota bacterium]
MTAAQDSTDGGQQLLLGKKLLERGLITPDQLREALVERARHVAAGDRSGTPLGGILVSKGYLTNAQLLDVLNDGGRAGASAFLPSKSGSSATMPAATSTLPPPGASVTLPAAEVSSTATRLGKYVLVGELGRGGMGVVYEAIDSQLNRKVALKLMLANPNMDSKDRQLELERFAQEAQLSAKLKHPNIVTVYEAGVVEGRQFLAMELIEGRSFSDWRHGVSVRDQVALLRDVALAVHHAHEQGILHRDLKPRNILVGSGNRAYVTDFGLAKSLGKNVNLSLTGSGAVVGTPAYMSPEQAQGLDRVDWRTDIWSLGVILYEIMAGRTPFTGDSPIEILMKVVKDPVTPPLEVADSAAALGLDSMIEGICLKALAKKDKDRYITAEALADDLTKWLEGEQVKVVAPKARKPKKSSRGGLLKAIAGIVLLAGAGAAGWHLWQTRAVSPRADLDRAAEFMEQQKFDEALVLYRSVLGRAPDDKEAKAGEERALKSREDLRKAKEGEIKEKVSVHEQERERLLKQVAEIAMLMDASRSEEERRRLEEQRKTVMERIRQIEKEAETARVILREPGATPPAPPSGGAPSEDAWKNAINLFGHLDPQRHTVAGGWALLEGRLVSDRTPYARLEIPYNVPDEYDLRAVFTRQGGSDAVVLLLAAGARGCAFVLGGEDNQAIGFAEIAGDPSAALIRGERVLDNDRSYTAVVQVRRTGLRAFLDGREVAARETSFSDMAIPAAWSLRNTGVLGIGSHRSPTVFQRVDLLEISGRGRRAPPAPPLSLKAMTVSPGTMKAGLICEGYFGGEFRALAMRRVDPSVTADWREGPAWNGGPPDCFSVRWRGFVNVQRSGRYTFSLATDDAVRMELDGVQLFAGPATARQKPLTATCQMEEGYHALVVELSDEAFRSGIRLSWADGADAAPLLIPAKAFFHTGSEFQAVNPSRPPELVAELKGHSNSVTGVSFRPDGKVLASASEDHRVRFWDTASRKDLGQPAVHPRGVICVAFSAHGKTFATGAWDTKVRLWDVGTSTLVRTFDGHTSFVQSVVFSADGRSLASASYDRTARLWDLETGETAAIFQGHTAGVEGVAFSPDGRRIATASLDRTVRLWDAESGKVIRSFDGHADGVSAVAFAPGGQWLASGGLDDTVRLWDVETGAQTRRLEAGGGGVLSVAISPDGRTIAAGTVDGLATLWEIESGKPLKRFPGHSGRVISVAFSQDGRQLATGSFDGTARLWVVQPK